MDNDISVSYQLILDAHKRVKPFIHQTPVFTSSFFNRRTGGELFFKCENFQKMGAFKIRGAANAMLSIGKEQLKAGVATHSSGNHGQAVALVAGLMNIKAYVVVPRSAPETKINAILEYGAEIEYCEPNINSRDITLNELIKRTGARMIHPFNDNSVIAGQGTLALELNQQVPNLDAIVAPVGGGGLISGVAIASHALHPEIQIFGAEPSGADDTFRSLETGSIVPNLYPRSIADGLLATVGTKTFPVIKKEVSSIIKVDDEEIVSAMKMIWERMKIIVEASAAISLAAVFKNPDFFEGKRTGIIISGGNVDLQKRLF